MGMRVLSCGLLCVAMSAWAQPSYQASAGRTLIRAGHVIDVHTGNELADETVIVQGDKIVGLAMLRTRRRSREIAWLILRSTPCCRG